VTTNTQPAPEAKPGLLAEPKPALLVVDDDPLITDTLAFALGPDFVVYACESRPNAIELLRQCPRTRILPRKASSSSRIFSPTRPP
jgi:hypothetical protein